MSRKPKLTRAQKSTILEGVNLVVTLMVVLQLWLLTATMNAWLGGDTGSAGRRRPPAWAASPSTAGCCASRSPRFGTIADMNARDLPPNIFAIVMATGIVSTAAQGAGMPGVARVLFGVNVLVYPLLWGLLGVRCVRHYDAFRADLRSHAAAPGFFTIVAATCILGNQFVLLGVSHAAALWLWLAGSAFWIVLTYTILPWLMEQEVKPPLEKGISGAWLVTVVGTQSVSVLGSLVVADLPAGWGPFIPFCLWLVGGMLYVWLISLIFYRIMFLPLAPGDLTPPYWINMGAMAISTLAGARVAALADRSPLVAELLPFVKGGTLLFWATASWWIPVLLTLGAWRHVGRKYPLRYDHGYWSPCSRSGCILWRRRRWPTRSGCRS